MKRVIAALVLVGVFSLAQYVNTGTVSWPNTLLDKLTHTLRDFATRPEAGWRDVADALEQMGAAREGVPTPEFALTGRVVRVADGDTVSILDSHNVQHKVRLYGIDTPERDQPYGPEARRALARLVDGKTVGLVLIDTDTYGRKVGTVYLQDTNINVSMVAAGHAWWYRHYAPHDRKLADSEYQAREQRLGLWTTTAPVPPWEWRRGERQ